MPKTDLPIATVLRIMRRAGAERVAEDVQERLAERLAEYCVVVTKRSLEVCQHAGRKTIILDDLRLALDNIRARSTNGNGPQNGAT